MSQLSQASVKAIMAEDYLAAGDLKPTELVKRLQKLHKFLQGIVSIEDTEQQKLDTISAALVQPDLLKHDNSDVRLLVGCCLTDIIRIYTPDAPYDDTQLEALFSLVIKELHGLQNTTDKSFTLRYYILENLEAVKAFNILIDLNNDAMFVELFKTFFDCITEEHSVAVVTCMLDIMQTFLAESEELTQELLDTILMNLLPETKKEHPAAYKLTQQLIKASSKLLQPVLTQFLNSIILDVKASDSELKDKAHVLIWELNRIEPDLLLYVLPELKNELIVDIQEKRKAAVKLLSRMFAAKNSNLHMSYPELFSTFMGRFHDVDTDIRCSLLSFAPGFVKEHPEVSHLIIEALNQRIRDPEEAVRLAAVEAVCKLTLENPDVMNKALLNEAGVRMRDKKPEVRKVAMLRFAELYKALVQKWGMPSQWTEKQSKAYGWIPTKVLHVYYQNDPELRIALDDVLDHCLLPDDYDTKKRTELLLEIRSTMDKNAADAIIKLLKDKRSFQTDFANFLDIKKRQQKKPNDKALEAELANTVAALTQRLPGGSGKWNSFSSMKSVATWKQLAKLAEPDLEYTKIRKAAAEALDTMHKKSKEGAAGEYMKKIVQKLSMTVVNKQAVPYLFAALKGALSDEPSVAMSILSFIEELSAIFPSFFSSSFQQLSVLLEEDDVQVVDKALKIFGNVGEQLAESTETATKKVKKRLCSLCTDGTPLQAKLAVKAINKIYADKSAIFNSIAKEVVPHLQLKDKACVTSLQALAHIAKGDAAVFARYADKVLDFVIEKLLPSSKGTKGSQQAVELCKWKMIGMKALVHYLQAQEGDDEDVLDTARKVVRVFLDILENEKGSSKTKNEPEREYMRQSAAISLLKLARHRNYESLLTEDDFQQLAYTIQDPCFEVRAAILDAVSKGLLSLRLPLKYNVLLVLCATDPEKKAIVAKARQQLALNIKIRRQILDTLDKDALSKQGKSIFGVLPEYVMPYLIHFLAHRSDWKDDVPEYKTATRYISFFLEQLHLGDNVSFLHALLAFMKQTQDAQEPPLEENIRILCDIALLYIGSRASSKGKLNQTTYPGNLYLPPSLFRVTEDDTALQKELVEGGKSYLPLNFTLPNTKMEKIFNKEAPSPIAEKTAGKRKAPATSPIKSPKKRLKKGDDDDFEGPSKKEKESPRRMSLSRKAKDDTPHRKEQEEEESSGEDAEKVPASRKRKATKPAPKKNAPKRTRKAKEPEEEEAPKPAKKGSTKGKSTMKGEAEEAPAKTTKKSAAAKKGTSPKGKKGTEKEEENEEEEEEAKPTTRGRKTKGVKENGEGEETAKASGKKGKAARKGAEVFDVSSEEDGEEEEEAPKRNKAATKAKGAKAARNKKTADAEPAKTHTVRRTAKRRGSK